MIIYIHGFGGSGKGMKASILRENLNELHKTIAPTLSYLPDLAIDTLSQIIESLQKYEEIYLIGSSLGGYFSIYLADKYNLKAALINPSIHPDDTLREMKGYALNYGDLSKFEWNQGHIDMLNHYKLQTITPSRYLLLTQTGDELLDYKVGVEYLQGAQQIIVEGGDHSFVGIENYTNDILNFFGIKNDK